MHPHKIHNWVRALRSGEFVKGVGSLRQDDNSGNPVGYCCLGVWCEINGVNYTGTSGRLPIKEASQFEYVYIENFDNTEGEPLLPIVDREGEFVTLSGLNDPPIDIPFSQIADLIEYFLTPGTRNYNEA